MFNLLATNSHLEEKQISATNFALEPEKSLEAEKNTNFLKDFNFQLSTGNKVAAFSLSLCIELIFDHDKDTKKIKYLSCETWWGRVVKKRFNIL